MLHPSVSPFVRIFGSTYPVVYPVFAAVSVYTEQYIRQTIRIENYAFYIISQNSNFVQSFCRNNANNFHFVFIACIYLHLIFVIITYLCMQITIFVVLFFTFLSYGNGYSSKICILCGFGLDIVTKLCYNETVKARILHKF